MANELRGVTATGQTVYALIVNSSGQLWNGSSFESYASGNYGTYDISMIEQGSSGIYFGTFPSGITSSGTYEFFVRRALVAGTPAEGDPTVNTGEIDWTGSSSVVAASGSMSGSEWRDYILRGGFKRTDKDTEVYEETTDAIQEMRRRFMFDEAEAETTTTDLITTLGDFKIDVEGDFGLLLGVLIEDDDTATPLRQRTKDEFNRLYPDINVTNDRGYPKDFTIYAGSIQIGPVPDRTDYVYRKAYSLRAGTVTSVTTAVPFTRDYRDVLRDNVLARLYKLMDEFDKMREFRQMFEDGFMNAKRRERTNSGATSFNVKPFGM